MWYSVVCIHRFAKADPLTTKMWKRVSAESVSCPGVFIDSLACFDLDQSVKQYNIASLFPLKPTRCRRMLCSNATDWPGCCTRCILMLWCGPCYAMLLSFGVSDAKLLSSGCHGMGFGWLWRKATEFQGAVLENMNKKACDAPLNGLPQLTDAARPWRCPFRNEKG